LKFKGVIGSAKYWGLLGYYAISRVNSSRRFGGPEGEGTVFL